MADDKRQQDNLDPQKRPDTSQMRGQPSPTSQDINMKQSDMNNLGHKGGKAQGSQKLADEDL